MSRRPWPKLSETLSGPKQPGACQGCGTELGEFTLWQECDEADQPTAVIVILCTSCGDQRIEKHPRLYHDLHKYAPMPGSMQLCKACLHHDGVTCRHPDLKANGGPGLLIHFPPPRTIFWDGTTKGGGRRKGWVETVYPGPPTACAGREIKKEEHNGA